MNQKLFGFLSGWQFTVLAMTAMIVPGALYAAVSYTAVGIIDPLTGAKSKVDLARRLNVYDPVSGYANDPSNLVTISLNPIGSSPTCNSNIYTPPSGKALVIRSIEGFLIPGGGGNTAGFYLESGTCSTQLASFYTGTSNGIYAPFDVSLGSGATVPAGQSLSAYVYNAGVRLLVHGYLVPASEVPAAGTSAAETINPRADIATASPKDLSRGPSR